MSLSHTRAERFGRILRSTTDKQDRDAEYGYRRYRRYRAAPTLIRQGAQTAQKIDAFFPFKPEKSHAARRSMNEGGSSPNFVSVVLKDHADAVYYVQSKFQNFLQPWWII